ncbi:tetratricopeptide repeat protein [Chryseobacterium turcicum]|uniref:LuxR C-terminal-related transcriptional regulator n=1 Tax=Chryseobacterium turcicum TaxID=2898076 RepID=A0A9Q3V5K7_9FLAO|nr:LuxR C-terminal-related transcriptional regulator [Chryseobacterium turcicum]MCD1117130.1 LuxR C-terminal-related transcriptional regulator [Chryseobacterium turcicum]
MVAQNKVTAKELKTKISNNTKLYKANIDEAYKELNNLLKESVILKDSISEMKLLDRKCRYFYSKNMMDSLIITSENLQKKSHQYKDVYFEAMSNIYIAETYSINKFPDKAIAYLNSAYKILQKGDANSERIFYAKANVLSSFANIYLDKNQPKEAAKKIYEQIESGKKLKDKYERDNFQYLNYANLANIYSQINADSAYHYAKKSILIKPGDIIDDKSMIDNYSVIGKVYKDKGNYESALKNFHKALFISKKTGTEINTNQIYHSLKEIYEILQVNDSINFYGNKIEQYELKALKSKYNSLQEVINKDKKEQENSQNALWFWIVPALASIGVISFFVYKRKGKRTIETKNNNEIKPEINLSEAYHDLMKLLEKRDPAFIFAFENIYPDFSSKLLAKSSDLQQSEIEFCALLKMKLTTKEIAKISFIETRTVQNKKYRIRKKLDIPQNVDIYHWIDQI